MRFDRNHVHAYADVIVAAAPNAKRARQEYRVSDDALLDALRDRIRFVLAICDELGREKLVLGAWGCDNNGFDAKVLAASFHEPQEVSRAYAAGAHSATVAPSVIEQGLSEPPMRRAVQDFTADFEAIHGPGSNLTTV